jgi:Arc/MetJ-type ribon-helix-helix transcriptional regulator
MTIQLKPDQERMIQEEIEKGHFRSPDEVLDHALAALREKNSPRPIEPHKQRRNLADVLSNPPFAGSELDLSRIRDYPKPLDL